MTHVSVTQQTYNIITVFLHSVFFTIFRSIIDWCCQHLKLFEEVNDLEKLICIVAVMLLLSSASYAHAGTIGDAPGTPGSGLKEKNRYKRPVKTPTCFCTWHKQFFLHMV